MTIEVQITAFINLGIMCINA